MARTANASVGSRPDRSARAATCGRYWSCSAARSTASRARALTGARPVNTADTVLGETPASRATSRTDGRRRDSSRTRIVAIPWLP
jgi:hypothetical protein